MRSVVTLPRGLTTVSLLVVTLWGVSQAQDFLIPISISAILAFMMMPLVRVMRRYRFPEWSAIAASTLLLILPFLSFVSLLVWQGQAFIRDFPHIMVGINQVLLRFVNSEWGQRLHISPEFNLLALVQKFEGSAGQGVQLLISGLGAVLGAGTHLLLVLLFAVLMLVSRRHIRASMEEILKRSFNLEQPRLLDEISELIERFLVARLLIVLIVGGIDAGILIFFHVEYAVLLGTFLGVMTLIPAVGFIIAALPPLVVSLAMGNTVLKTLGMFLSLVGVSAIESHLLTPKMVGGRLNINILSTFMGLFAGGLLWGIWGMFISIPVLGILRIVFTLTPSLQPWGELLEDRPSPKTVVPATTQSREKVA
jgi:predicted PurR-regulated permease PerM